MSEHKVRPLKDLKDQAIFLLAPLLVIIERLGVEPENVTAFNLYLKDGELVAFSVLEKAEVLYTLGFGSGMAFKDLQYRAAEIERKEAADDPEH